MTTNGRHLENLVWRDSVSERIANSIYAYLERTGKSQRQLAKELDVVPAQITRYLSGENLPALTGLKALADLFHLPVGYFLDGDATNTQEPR